MYSLEYAKTLLSEADLAQRSRPCLLIIRENIGLPGEENSPRQIIYLNQPMFVIGRDPTCTLHLADRYVSRFHGILTVAEDQPGESYELRDGDGHDKPSANGVFVRGQRLKGSHFLQDGDPIRFGTRVYANFHEIRIPTPVDHQRHQILKTLLVEMGLVSPEQMEQACSLQQRTGMLLGEAVIAQGWVRLETIEFLLQDQNKPDLPMGVKHPIGEYMRAAGLVTETQIVEALRLQKRQKIYFGRALVEQGFIREQTLEFFLSRFGDMQDSTSKTLLG
ncbi:MAG: FHA domain-containing protein [Cyanobacteriota bacterium]|nr:FHA domain-containing protein [Cyanobacteriota bacterium]